MSATWLATIDAGVDIVPLDADHVRLRRGRQQVSLRYLERARPITPSAVAALIERYEEPTFLVVPSATPAVRRAVEDAGWSWLTAGDAVAGALRIGNVVVRIGSRDAAPRPARGKRGRAPWRSLAVVRLLIRRPGATQVALAEAAGVSQPRVSQVLAPLVEQGLVARSATGWAVRDFDGLVAHWLDTYPGPGGITTYWHGLDPPRRQVEAVLRSKRLGIGPVVSGDVAADLLAPWRNPSRAVVYARGGADLSKAGLTAAGHEEATLELIVPRDPGILSANTGDAALPLADPLQILWDVRRLPGSDREEAAAVLWRHLRRRSSETAG
jgi:hypothetical protein